MFFDSIVIWFWVSCSHCTFIERAFWGNSIQALVLFGSEGIKGFKVGSGVWGVRVQKHRGFKEQACTEPVFAVSG